MRELANHQPAAVQSRQHLAFARDALARPGVGQFQQQMGARDLTFERRRGDVHHHRVALAGQTGRDQQNFMPGAGFIARKRAAQDTVQRQWVGK